MAAASSSTAATVEAVAPRARDRGVSRTRRRDPEPAVGGHQIEALGIDRTCASNERRTSGRTSPRKLCMMSPSSIEVLLQTPPRHRSDPKITDFFRNGNGGQLDVRLRRRLVVVVVAAAAAAAAAVAAALMST
jgi:hypothetical protein